MPKPRKNSALRTPHSALPEADQQLARQREMELAVLEKTIAEINRRADAYPAAGQRIVQNLINWVNDGRTIGLLIIGFVDALPGKRMTPDFWQQWKGKFVGPSGTQLTYEQFNWFERLARNHPEPINTMAAAMNARQMAFAAGGFALISERPPGTAHAHVPFNDFMSIFTGFKPVLEKLEKDPNYGPIEHWPPDRKERAWLEIQPFYERVIKKLKPANV